MRTSKITRKTKETAISLSLEILDKGERGSFSGTSGIGFFDHMLNSFAVHGGFNINLECEGDVYVDGHHTVEDVGIVLGKALHEAAGDMKGITRFSDMLMPMDEALCMCAVDYSGRPYLAFDADFKSVSIGGYDTQLTVEFMRALAYNALITLHVKMLYGDNDHHKTEAIYKSVGKCIGKALEISGSAVPSAKGVL